MEESEAVEVAYWLITCWCWGMILSPCGDEEYKKKPKEIFSGKPGEK